ncbi:LLM class flavin-dependent oxidoreductase [Ktedonosporobacter rubrisoli]|uniref:LLM class flavin-dependent oxidoreductase n=1 Tax=Ktedonosporobacter rubrisoli TaxID=2509675 RepID=A0A4P6JPI0_KTERU|nr:LLM class flavin-dependent oxidoreductase [Ktedonosporobacter rubrisoli]QBD77185.1 LLM class flavin-dependent oxidoreductase [Ktedonosporobacter rubrisoli]
MIAKQAASRSQGHQRPLKVGLILPSWTDGMDGKTPRWADILTLARQAEDAGFDSLWVTDDLILRMENGEMLGMWECWSLLAGLAAETSRVQLGSFVSCNNFRNPALLAKIATTVDEISGGRLILGLGTGAMEEEHRAFGFPWEQRFGRFEEALRIIHSLLKTGHAHFIGKHYQVCDCELSPGGPQKEGPPILIGTSENPGPRLLRLVAQYADIWNGYWSSGQCIPERIDALHVKVDDACHQFQRPPTTLERTIEVKVTFAGRDVNAWPQERAQTGKPEELAALFRAFAQQGISHLQVGLAPNTAVGIEALAQTLALLDKDDCKPIL